MSTKSVIKKPVSFSKTRYSVKSIKNLIDFNKKNIIDKDDDSSFFDTINSNFKNNINLLSLNTLFSKDEKKAPTYDKMIEWTHDDDADEFYEAFTDRNIKLNFKIANFFFRKYINQHAKIPSIVIELIRIINEEPRQENDDDKLIIFKKILISSIKILALLIINFNKRLYSLKKYFTITKQELPEYIILYRGFAYGHNNEILHDVNSQISSKNSLVTIHSVLSTSIKLSVAIKFSTNNGTIWRIIVNKEKFEKFKYSYLSEDIIIDKDNIINDSPENEFLLNYGIKLIDMGFKHIIHNGMNLTIRTFTFDDYDIHQIDSNFKDFCNISLDYIDKIKTLDL